ncbi:putative membrane protein [Helicobacter pylori Hp A-16]|nr:putative membrane protein [Helicobacter pylori Hp A-16]
MVKERPEEARNSLKGNFYSFLPLLLGGFWRALEGFGSPLFSAFLFSFLFSLFLLKFQINV